MSDFDTGYKYGVDESMGEIKRLRKDNEKLRGVLNNVIAFHGIDNRNVYRDIDGKLYDLDLKPLLDILKEIDKG